jgi:hypothetical protein
VIASGDGLAQDIHAQLHLRSGATDAFVWENLPDDPSDSYVEFWWPAGSKARMKVTAPSGEASEWVECGQTAALTRNGRTAALLIACGKPCQSNSGAAMALLAVAPTADGTAPYGRWLIEAENDAAGVVVVDAWCERDDPVFGNEGGPRQARFVAQVEKTGTLNAIAHGQFSTVVGGYVIHDTDAPNPSQGPVFQESGTGPGRGLPGRNRNPAGPKRGPEVLGPADSGMQEGLLGAAVLSGDKVRLNGTSFAAARYTRAYINAGFATPTLHRPRSSPPVPGRNRHPDDDLIDPLPRVS